MGAIDVFKPSRQACEIKTFTRNAMAKNIGGAVATSAIAVFLAPTVVPLDIWGGLFLLLTFGILSFLASYGLNYECAQRSGGWEFVLAFTSAFLFSMLMARVYLKIPFEVLFSLDVLKTEVVVSTSIGGFFGSILK